MSAKRKIAYSLFVVAILGIIAFGIYIVRRNANLSVNTFTFDGYAIYLSPNSIKAEVVPFKNGKQYAFKKYGNKISVESNEGDVFVEENAVIHYQNGNFVVLKNVVGLDLDKIDDEVILYYNLFKNTEVKHNKTTNDYYVEGVDQKTTFNKMLIRIEENKYLLAGDNIRVILFDEQVIDFGKYVYFEYVNGSIVKLYNNDKYYQTLAGDSQVVVDNLKIDLKSKIVSKDNKAKITLSNLVIDMDGNIDVITEEAIVDKAKVEKPNIGQDVINGPTPTDNEGNNGGSISGEDETNEDEKVNNKTYYKEPVFHVTSLDVTAMKIDANVEIVDEDELLINPVKFSIVENADAKVVYEEELVDGNLNAYISYPNLKPDTEYTLYGKASYKVDEVTLEKSFVSKIFRTEALGVSFRKSYVTKDSIVVDLYKESYSKVSSVTIGIYDENGNLLDYKNVDLLDKTKNKYEIEFPDLSSNTKYIVKMYDILSGGVIVDDGFSQVQTIKTLKKAPKIEDLTYRVNKVDAAFELNVSKVIDEDYGVYNYRYEIFDTRQDLNTDTPILSIDQKQLGPMTVVVDDAKIHRGVAYTYRLIVEFNDNEKTVEYFKNLGTVMQLDGVEFPTVRWEETSVTWEQINGAIVIDDPSGTLQSNVYRVVYKDSVNMYTTKTIITETPQNVLPIAVNYLRANETYTFDVYANINLQDGNPTVSQSYIGSVNVQTKSPKSLQATFAKNESYSDVFSLQFSLVDANENASFEASTLTVLNFTLYQGTTTDGKVEVAKKKIDLNDDEYVSTLKQMFYDDSATINANFFDADDSDFHQKTYTLVVDGAYDYTGYDSNIIPIENNVFQFEVNNYIPDIPDPDSVQVTTRLILNKFASSFGFEYDEGLDANTIIGVNAIASYDNNSGTGKYIIYHTWVKNPNTGEYEMIEELDKKVFFNEDGTLSSTNIPVLNGTANDVVDRDAIRRGNEYYISYEAYLDMDYDGEVDTIYPKSIDENVVLKSEELKIRKQLAVFTLYPSLSGSDYMTWRYKYIDYDSVLANNNLYGYINANSSPSSSPEISLNADYQSATFTGLSKGKTLTIRKAEKTLKTDEPVYRTLTSQYFYGYNATIALSYTVESEDNVITLTINNNNSTTNELINSISSVDVVVEPVNASDRARLGVKTLENVRLKNNKVVIDYFDISEYYNVDVSIKLVANYDSGEIGYDYESPKIALQNGTYSGVGSYYTFSGQFLTQVSEVYRNTLQMTFNPYSKTLSLTNNNNKTINLPIDIDQTGVIYDDNNLIAKNIRSGNLSSSNNRVKFSHIIPGISLLNDDDHIDITPLLTGVYVNADITNYQSTTIQDDLIYFELYQIDTNGTGAQYLGSLSHTISEFENPILIDNLIHKTNYYIKVYANVLNPETNTYEKQYLYDMDQQAVGCIYNFHTLSDVGIKNIKVRFVANSYTDKKLSIDYELENVIGFNYIKYELYKQTSNGYERVNINIPNSTNFFKEMHLEISASPSLANEIVYSGKYRLVISAYGEYTSNGEVHGLSLGSNSKNFEVPKYEQPHIGITAGKSEGEIYFRVTITDKSHVINNDVYSVRLLDSNNNVVAGTDGVSVRLINKKFTFDEETYNLVNGEVYTFDVSINNDYTNTKQNLVPVHKSRKIQYGSAIDLGTVVLYENKTTPNAFDLIFSDSYRLTSIDSVTYSISSITTGFYISNSGAFNVRYDSARNIYIYSFNLEDTVFDENDVYLFTFNFYQDGTLVNEAEFDYYVGGDSDETTP